MITRTVTSIIYQACAIKTENGEIKSRLLNDKKYVLGRQLSDTKKRELFKSELEEGEQLVITGEIEKTEKYQLSISKFMELAAKVE